MNIPHIPDERLMAYADGELAPAEREAVERALAADPALAARLRQHQALRTQLEQAFAAELNEPVPERLTRAVSSGPAPAKAAAPVVSLAAHRLARGPDAAPPAPRGGWTWAHWGGLAASLAFGVLVGRFSGPGAPGVDGGGALAMQGSRLIASGALQAALDGASAAAPASSSSTVAVQLSFVDRRNSYCRTFSTTGQAGLACREGDAWALQLLVDAPRGPTDGAMRQAASGLPTTVLAEVDRRIDGPVLDAAGERDAIARGWRR